MSKDLRKYLIGALIGSIIALLLVWAYVGNGANLQGKFKFQGKLTPVSVIKVLK